MGMNELATLLPLMKGEQGCLEGGCFLADGRRTGEAYLMGIGYAVVSGECRKVCEMFGTMLFGCNLKHLQLRLRKD